jgi:hypothetical protein
VALPSLSLAPLAAIPAPPIGGLEIGPLDIRFYGVLIALGAYLALQWTVRRYETMGGDGALAERAALAAILFGFLGARIGYVIPRFDRFVDRPLEVFAIWQGGLALFGGLTAGTIAVILVTRRGEGDVRAMADAVAPGLPLAQAIGRWGNYFNQELYGRPTDLPWALEVDPAFRRPLRSPDRPPSIRPSSTSPCGTSRSCCSWSASTGAGRCPEVRSSSSTPSATASDGSSPSCCASTPSSATAACPATTGWRSCSS